MFHKYNSMHFYKITVIFIFTVLWPGKTFHVVDFAFRHQGSFHNMIFTGRLPRNDVVNKNIDTQGL